MIREELRQLIEKALQEAAAGGGLPPLDDLPEIELEHPKEKAHGDWSTNLALTMAGRAAKPPRELAATIAEVVRAVEGSHDLLDGVEVAGPGFINFRLSRARLQAVPLDIEREGDRYGYRDVGGGLKTQVEFVSANPVGPMHVGHGRWAAVGDCLARVLSAAGFDVEREFYINDYGSQMAVFGRSVAARYAQILGIDTPFPEDGYHGAYIKDIAQEIVDTEGDHFLSMPEGERERIFRERAYRQVLEHLKKTLEAMGVIFDVWFSESDLYKTDEVTKTVEWLRRAGHVYDSEGAVWLRTTAFGDDKDRVLIRESGEPTYFGADIAYHRDKLARGFKKIINIWGADHHGYVKRMEAAVEALGHPPGTLEVIIGQLVNLYKGGEPVRMSKRTGEMVTLEELLAEVGKDPARYFFLMRGTDTSLDFDIDLARRQSQDNPIYYVQYAHARICSILRYAEEQGAQAAEPGDADLSGLNEAPELDLCRKLAEWPEVVEGAAVSRSPHFLPRYTVELARTFHAFYTECRVVTDDEPLTRARLVLARSTRQVLRNVLGLIGVDAPERM